MHGLEFEAYGLEFTASGLGLEDAIRTCPFCL